MGSFNSIGAPRAPVLSFGCLAWPFITDTMHTFPTLRSSSRVTILGAGLMGRLLAVELARQGHAVEVHEAGTRAAEGAAAYVAAAMVAPLAESIVAEPGVVRMGVHSLAR